MNVDRALKIVRAYRRERSGFITPGVLSERARIIRQIDSLKDELRGMDRAIAILDDAPTEEVGGQR